MKSLIFLIVLTINFDILIAYNEPDGNGSILKKKFLNFYENEQTEGSNAVDTLQCTDATGEDFCSYYEKFVKHVRCENLKFNKTKKIEELEWACSIETKKRYLKLNKFEISCDGYTYKKLPDDLQLNAFSKDLFKLIENFNPKTCFLKYSLLNVNLVKLENKIKLINTGVILVCSTSSLAAIFTAFLLYIQLRNPTFKPSESTETLPTADSSLDSPTANRKSFVFLNNINKNIGRFTKQLSSGFASTSGNALSS